MQLSKLSPKNINQTRKPGKILVVENSQFYSSLIIDAIAKVFPGSIDVASTFDEVKALLSSSANSYFLALLNLSLPGAPVGEAVAFVRSKNIASVVFTGSIEKDTISQIKALGVIDYVVKDSSANLDYLSRLVRRLDGNRRIKALVVDDSRVSRALMCQLLERQLLNTIEAEDGEEAFTLIEQDEEIKLVITDYEMPKMNGFELIKKVREIRNSKELAIIGISGVGDESLAANFMRYGADEFTTKPIRAEEFGARISLCMDRWDLLNDLSHSATTDYLTGLSNRRHFLDNAKALYASAKRKQVSISCAMIDIDFFKRINDTYGHDAGDTVLKSVAASLGNRVRETDLIARFGGEEFCLLGVNINPESQIDFFNELRTTISDLEFDLNNEMVRVTVSIGVTRNLGDSIEDMIDAADKGLYVAKETGRNRVVFAADQNSFNEIVS